MSVVLGYALRICLANMFVLHGGGLYTDTLPVRLTLRVYGASYREGCVCVPVSRGTYGVGAEADGSSAGQSELEHGEGGRAAELHRGGDELVSTGNHSAVCLHCPWGQRSVLPVNTILGTGILRRLPASVLGVNEGTDIV